MVGLAIGGATASLLGLVETAAGKQGDAGPRDGVRGDRGNKVQREKKKKQKLKAGPAGPPGPPGPPAQFATVVKDGQESEPLGVTAGSLVVGEVDCGGPGKAIGCGYQMSATPAQLVNVAVIRVEAYLNGSKCIAVIQRTAEAGSTAGARIEAIATCLA
jgi:hypothetical protein